MINERIFGTPITGSVRALLEARQQVAGQIGPGESLKGKKMIDGVFPDSTGNVQAYLSSRTPFVRMWTSVKLIESGEAAEKLKEIDVNSSDEEKLKEFREGIKSKFGEEYPRVHIVPIYKGPVRIGAGPNTVEKYVVYSSAEDRDQWDYARKVYQIGNHAYQEAYGEVAPNSSNQAENLGDSFSQTGTEEAGEALASTLPHQLKENPLMRPQAGITSVDCSTQGSLGLYRTTEVKFTVPNFYDFDKIYSKYFLVPGASIFVDFGWSDVLDLYNPQELLDHTGFKDIQEFLYSEQTGSSQGYITKNEGEVEVLQGVVTDYNAKILPTGAVDCSVTLTSANSALLSQKVDDNLIARLKSILTRGIIYMAMYEIVDKVPNQKVGNSKYYEKDLEELKATPNYDDSAEDRETYDRNLLLGAQKQLGHTGAPNYNAVRTGVYVDQLTVPNVYINWGLFEDLIINSQFGFGKDVESIVDGKNLEVKLNSSNSFTGWTPAAFEKQHVMLSVPEEPPVVVFPRWYLRKGRPEEGSYNFQKKKYPIKDYELKRNVLGVDEVEWYKYRARKMDRELNRIPLREVFVNVEVIIKAFEANVKIKDVLKEICTKCNEDMTGLMDWDLKTGDTDAELMIVDKNKTISEENEKIIIQDEPYFTFNIMSPNSIVKDYDLSFKLPGGSIGNMYAIQGMSHGNTIFSKDPAVQKAISTAAIEEDLLRIIYEPDLGTHALETLLENKNDGEAWNVYAEVNKLMDKGIYKAQTQKDGYGVGTDKTRTQGNVKGYGTSTKGLFQYPLVVPTAVMGEKELARKDLETVKDEDLIKRNVETAQYLGYRVANNFKEYYDFKMIVENRMVVPNLLPYSLTLTIHGISTIRPGDTFKVDYLPERYQQYTYLQVTKVIHNINSQGWNTTLETQFRLVASADNFAYDNTDLEKVILHPNALQSAGFEQAIKLDDGWIWDSGFNMRDLAPYINFIKIEYDNTRSVRGIDYILEFETTEGAWKGLAKKAKKVIIYHTKTRFMWVGQNSQITKTALSNYKMKSGTHYVTTDMLGDTYNWAVTLPGFTMKSGRKYAIFIKGNTMGIVEKADKNGNVLDSYKKIKKFWVEVPGHKDYGEQFDLWDNPQT